MPVETFDGQITRANVQLAVRSGVLTEEEAARYWQTRRKFRTLSDSNSQKTIQKVTREYTSASTLLERERGEKRKLEEEVRTLPRQEDARGALRARAAPSTWNTGRGTRTCQGGTRHLAHRKRYARVPGRHPAPGTQEEVRARARAAHRRQLVMSDPVSGELVGQGGRHTKERTMCTAAR